MFQFQRSDRQNGNTGFINQKRIFIGSMGRSPVFHDPQPPGGNLIDHTEIEQDNAVRNIFFQALAG